MDKGPESPKDRDTRPSEPGPPGHEGGPGGARPEQADQPVRQGVSVKDRRKLHAPDAARIIDATPPQAEAAVEPDHDAGGDRLAMARAEAASHLNDLRRLKAEFDNYRKRVLREQTALAESASGTLAARLLGVLDNFELAVAAAEETRDFEKMLKGVEMVYGELKEVLHSEGLEPIEAKGKPFDPHLHEAALEVPGDDSGNLVVAEVLRPGYSFKGKVVRPAMVKVTQSKA